MIFDRLFQPFRHGFRCLLLIALCGLMSGCGLVSRSINTAIAVAPLKLLFQCLPEGTMIDTPDGSRAVETLRPGETITGFSGKPVKVLQIHAYAEDRDSDEFRRVAFTNGAVVDLCARHRIHGIRAGDLEAGALLKSGHVVDSITPYSGVERSYDLLTEDEGYRVGGVPVNSMIEEMYAYGRSGGRKSEENHPR